jgi:hypothetical protein
LKKKYNDIQRQKPNGDSTSLPNLFATVRTQTNKQTSKQTNKQTNKKIKK